jgi:UPF0271 protein
MIAERTDPVIDLNADVGEGFDDRGIAPAVSSLNIACGAHAGSERTMRAALALARDFGLAAGAHPGYPDREGFGRIESGLPAEAIAVSVRHQVASLAAMARESGLRLGYVKPHGALYHRTTRDRETARAVVQTIAAIDPGLAVLGWPGGELLAAARETADLDPGLAVLGWPGSELLAAAADSGLAAIPEGFVDRRYAPDGSLVARSRPGALLEGAEALAQAVALAAGGAPRRAESLCLHSDSPGAVELALAVRRALEGAGVVVAPFANAARVPAIPVVRVVGAAIVEAGRVLLTRRGERMSMAGKWEFPGGKLEAGESPREALVREVAEELGLEIETAERLGRGTSVHDGRRIELEVFVARQRAGELRLVEHEEHGWFGAGEIAGLDWPEADLPVLPALERLLRSREGLG